MKNNNNGEKRTISFYADGRTANVLAGLSEQYQISKSQIVVLALRSFEQYLKEGLLGIKKGQTEIIYYNEYGGGKDE